MRDFVNAGCEGQGGGHAFHLFFSSTFNYGAFLLFDGVGTNN